MSTAPKAPLAPKAVRREEKKIAERKGSWREKKSQRQKYLINVLLAFVFGITSVAFFAMNPFSGIQGSTAPDSQASVDPAVAELKGAQDRVAASPNDAGAWFDLGEVLYKNEKWPDAADAYRKALSHDPDNVMAMSHLGATLMNEEKINEAQPILEKAQATEKEQIKARQAKASASPSASADDGEQADSGDAVDVASTEDINIPERLYQIYTVEGQHDQAADELSRAKDIDVLHVQQFLLTQSEAMYVEKNQIDLGTKYMEDGIAAGAHVGAPVKEKLYPQLVLMSVMSASQDKAHPEKETRVREWLKLLSQKLAKTDPDMGKKIGDLVNSLTQPAPKKKTAATGAAPAAMVSGSPAAAPSTGTTMTAPATSAAAPTPGVK